MASRGSSNHSTVSSPPGSTNDRLGADNELLALLERDELDRRDVLARPVVWTNLIVAGALPEHFLSRDQLEALVAYDSALLDVRARIHVVAERASLLVSALLSVLGAMHSLDDVKYTLTLLYDLVTIQDPLQGAGVGDSDTHASDAVGAALIVSALSSSETSSVLVSPFAPLLALVTRRSDDAYIVRHCGAILNAALARLVTASSAANTPTTNNRAPLIADASDIVARAMLACVRSGHERVQIAALAQIRTLLTVPALRSVAVRVPTIVAALVNVLLETTNSSAYMQRLYEAVYGLWLLSFDPRARVQLLEEPVLIPLCALLRRVRRAKVVRLVIATLCSLLQSSSASSDRVADSLLASDAPKTLAQLAAKNKQEWGDDDLGEDLERVVAAVDAHAEALSSFTRYTFELASGALEWSPSHRSERFWQENALKFEDDDLKALRALKVLLEVPKQDARTLAVAAWDVGELARFHPRGKALVASVELKMPIMKLLNHGDESVRHEALLSLQKMLVQNWEYLANNSSNTSTGRS